MIQYPSLDRLALRNTWLTIGIFDGVHLGHRALLHRLVEGARKEGALSVVLTFDPHPAVVLGGRTDFKFLTTPPERLTLLKALGVEVCITQTFDLAFAGQTAGEFMGRVGQAMNLRHLVLGYDTALGKDREGDAPRLEELGRKLGYTVENVAPLQHAAKIISSGSIRVLIQDGKVAEAAGLLGGWYTVSGPVVHGDGRGRHINLPTANLDYPASKLIPASGIYATWAWIDGERWAAATNIGINPTFTPEKTSSTIETHLLDFDRDLYGQEIKLEFVARLREEMRFPSVEALLEQIHSDIDQTRTLLK